MHVLLSFRIKVGHLATLFHDIKIDKSTKYSKYNHRFKMSNCTISDYERNACTNSRKVKFKQNSNSRRADQLLTFNPFALHHKTAI